MELVSVCKNDDHETCSKYSKMELDRDGDTYANKDQKLCQTEARAQNRGLSAGNKCVVLITVCFGLTCIFLVATIVFMHIKHTPDREVQATHMLQSSSRDQTEKDQVQESFNSLSQKNLELETRVKNLTREKSQLKTRVNDLTTGKNQLQSNFNFLSKMNLERETRVKNLTTEKSQLQSNFNSLSQRKLELETRVIDLTAEKSQLQSNFSSLSQKKLELETRVKDLTKARSQLETRVNDLNADKNQLQSNFSSLSQKKLELNARVNHLTTEKNRLEARVNDLIAGKNQLQSNINSLSQRKLELETRVNNLTADKNQLQNNLNSLNQKKLKLETELTKLSEQAGFLFMSREEKSWSKSRQYCRDHGGDLVIIHSEEKQRFISSVVKDRVWIGLSDIENESNMKWVDNSPLKQGFWADGEPNDDAGIEDCTELRPSKPVLNNWNDLPCSINRKGVCETKFHP